MFTEIRSKRGLAYDVGTQSISERSFGYFAIYATIDRKNTLLVKELILAELEKMKTISKKDLKEAQDYIEGDYLLGIEDSQKVADQLLFWEHVSGAESINKYIKKISKITRLEVKKVIEKYFKYHALVVLEGK